MQPQRFGRYELTQRVGVGGMAETWLARMSGAAGVSKSVVLKRIRPELSGDESFVRMFVNEARIAATLSHGNIAQVFDFGELDGEYFLAMEHVDGKNLSRVLWDAAKGGIGMLPLPFALYIARAMSEGLHYAHSKNIVHRDISPENVMLSFDGQVKVIDFGIAKAPMAEKDLTSPGVMKGKLHYASPEQLKLEPLDARTDVYSTGVVLYRMLCGRLPFEGEQQYAVVRKIVSGSAAPPRTLNPAIPVEVEEVLQRSMAIDRAARIATSRDFAEQLQALSAQLFPAFSAKWVEQLMGWLYSDELSKRGQQPQLPDEFTSQLETWRTKAPALDVPRPDAPTVAERSGGAEPRRGRGLGFALAAALLAVAGGSTWLTLEVLNRKATLVLNTTPLLAEVTLDGAPQPRGSPVRLEVKPGVRHHLEVSSPGFVRWRDDRSLEAGSETTVEVKLDPVPVPKPVEPETPQEPTPPVPAAPEVEASYPVASFSLSLSQHVTTVPSASGPEVVELSAGPVTLSTEGAFTYAYGWKRGSQVEATNVNSSAALYFLEGGTPAFGEVTPKPLTLKGRRLFLFLPDNSPMVRKGTLRVSVRQAGKTQVVLLDPRQHALRIDPLRQFTLRRLDERIAYRFELQKAPEASLGAAGRAERVLCMRSTSGFAIADSPMAPRISQVLEAGKPVDMTRVRELRCLLFDDVLDDNAGALEVKVVSLGVLASDPQAMVDELAKTGRMTLFGLQFEEKSDRLTASSEKQLNAAKQQLVRDPKLELSIEGHTDDRGTTAANVALSLERAEGVKRWLVSHGIAASRLEARGLGERQPIADNALEEGRALNRRVELVKR